VTIAVIAAQAPVNYIAALGRAGFVPKTYIVPDKLSWHEAGRTAREIADSHDALLLPGGGDMRPEFYGQELNGSRDINLNRDILELCALDAFIARRKPVLGICRGLQTINVYFGGTLFQDMNGHGQIDGNDSFHTVEWGGKQTEVNSAHHQAIDSLGNGLFMTAVSGDGIIEAVAHESLPVAAYQWHPERHSPTCETVFDRFMGLCKQYTTPLLGGSCDYALRGLCEADIFMN